MPSGLTMVQEPESSSFMSVDGFQMLIILKRSSSGASGLSSRNTVPGEWLVLESGQMMLFSREPLKTTLPRFGRVKWMPSSETASDVTRCDARPVHAG